MRHNSIYLLVISLLLPTPAMSLREHVPGLPTGREENKILVYADFQKLLSDDKLGKAFATCPLYTPSKNGGTHRGKNFWYVRALGAHLVSDEFRKQEAPALDYFEKTVYPDIKTRAQKLSPVPKDLDKLLTALDRAFVLKQSSSVPLKQIFASEQFKSLLAAMGL